MQSSSKEDQGDDEEHAVGRGRGGRSKCRKDESAGVPLNHILVFLERGPEFRDVVVVVVEVIRVARQERGGDEPEDKGEEFET